MSNMLLPNYGCTSDHIRPVVSSPQTNNNHSLVITTEFALTSYYLTYAVAVLLHVPMQTDEYCYYNETNKF